MFSCRFPSRVLLSLPKTVGAGDDALLRTEMNWLPVHVLLRMSARPGRLPTRIGLADR
jgi:hypothetical protein